MPAVRSDDIGICRLAVLGDTEWDKTKLVSKFILDQYTAPYESTTEGSYRKQVCIDAQTCIVEISDTSAQTFIKDEASAELSIKNADAFVLVYSIGSSWSFSRIHLYHAFITWVRGPQFPAMIFGTASDTNVRVVHSHQLISLSARLGCNLAANLLEYGENPLPDIIRYVRSWKLRKEGTGAGQEAVPRDHSPLSTRSRRHKISLLAELAETEHGEVERPGLALDRQLVWASRAGDSTLVKSLLKQGADLNAAIPNELGGPALYVAADRGYEGIVFLLLNSGANVSAQGPLNMTALQVASARGHRMIIRLLLCNQAEINQITPYGTALIAAAAGSHENIVRLLLRHGAEVNVQRGLYNNALFAAVVQENLLLVHMLIEAGADVNVVAADGSSALQTSVQRGYASITKLLLKSGARYKGSVVRPPNSLLGVTRTKSDQAIEEIAEDNGIPSNNSACPSSSNAERSSLLQLSAAKSIGEPARKRRGCPTKAELTMSETAATARGEVYHPPKGGTQEDLEARALARVSSEGGKEEVAVTEDMASHLPIRLATPLEDSHVMICGNIPDIPTAETTASLHKINDLSVGSGKEEIVHHYEYERKEEVPFRAMRNLGRGAFGFVEQVETVPRIGQTQETFARKLITLPPYRKDISELIKNEVNIVKRLNHHHIIQVISTYSARRDFGIIMAPIADMNLEEYFEQAEYPSESDNLYRWFGCLAAGLAYIHRERVKHRDIKPANILVKGDTILYTDFGIARDVWDEVTTSTTGYVDAKSPMYCAPEVAAEERRGRRSDVFSLGCIFLEMITVLMWKYDVSLEKLHHHKVTKGKRAYYANIDKTLQWMFQLYYCLCDTAEENRTGKSCLVPLDWCVGMLQPAAKDRVYAEALLGRVKNEDLQRPVHERPMTWSGFCCVDVKRDSYKKENTVLQGAWGHFWVWPDSADELRREESEQWNWQKANEVLQFNPEHETGSRVTYGG